MDGHINMGPRGMPRAKRVDQRQYEVCSGRVEEGILWATADYPRTETGPALVLQIDGSMRIKNKKVYNYIHQKSRMCKFELNKEARSILRGRGEEGLYFSCTLQYEISFHSYPAEMTFILFPAFVLLAGDGRGNAVVLNKKKRS